MQRNIHLPAPVKAEGAKASFKNGVMEITLQKEVAEEGTTIAIE
ncbi:MAG TPA: Hsp20 family protein [Methanocorpusculum sp.]|nr:Hsp20 family protein [Methanocorpusculum sp.]